VNVLTTSFKLFIAIELEEEVQREEEEEDCVCNAFNLGSIPLVEIVWAKRERRI